MEFSKSRLADRLVLSAIAHRISNDSGEAWPSVSTIAREANVSERSVHYSLRQLEKLGELEVNLNSSRVGTNTYKMPMFLLWVQSLHPPRVQNRARGVQSTAVRSKNVSQIAPEPSLREPSKEPSAAKGGPSVMETELHRQKRLDKDKLRHLELVVQRNPELEPAERARIQLEIDNLKRRLAA